MDLRASTSLSASGFTEFNERGVTLKSRTLKSWIKAKGLTQGIVAKRLGMSKRNFLGKVYRRKCFNLNEITALIRLMGASAAISVIWFPSLQEKQRIQKYVWEGRMSKKYNPDFPHQFETPAEKRQRAIAEQGREYGENWEQIAEFENLIFDSDELPSRKFMRRRNG